MYDLLEELGVDITVAHPLKVRAIADAKIKHDSMDAGTLARLLRTDLIPPVYVPPKDVRERKNLLRHRLWLVKLQTMTKNRGVRQLVDRNHVKTPKVTDLFDKTGTKFLKALELPGIDGKLSKDHLEIVDTHG